MNKWINVLPEDVYRRLCACHTRKSDIKTLVDAKWSYYKETGKDKIGFTKEDALISVLELLDCNSIDVDITKDEYNELSK